MANKTTAKAIKPASAPEAAKTAAPKAAASPKPAAPKITKVDRFFFLKGVGEGEKLAPQARVIINMMSQHPDGLSRAELVTAVTGKLNTRQPEGRILTYYQKSLVERGYIRIEQTEVTAPVADKPESAENTDSGA
jgi:hypothetical protein